MREGDIKIGKGDKKGVRASERERRWVTAGDEFVLFPVIFTVIPPTEAEQSSAFKGSSGQCPKFFHRTDCPVCRHGIK